MVKVKPCPHVHAGGALVHQAEQARSLNARLRGVRGPVALSSPAVARVVRFARALPPAQAVRVLSLLPRLDAAAACGGAGGVREGAWCRRRRRLDLSHKHFRTHVKN